MKTLISKLVLPAYLAGIAFAAYTGINLYLAASSIMKDHTVIEAPIELVDTSSRTKRGHTSITYDFTYSYVVDGIAYSSPYSAVNEHGVGLLALFVWGWSVAGKEDADEEENVDPSATPKLGA